MSVMAVMSGSLLRSATYLLFESSARKDRVKQIDTYMTSRVIRIVNVG